MVASFSACFVAKVGAALGILMPHWIQVPRRLYVPFSNSERGRATGLWRQSAGVQYLRGYDILPAKLADDRVHGSRWPSQQI